jgi:hypothetical protein
MTRVTLIVSAVVAAALLPTTASSAPRHYATGPITVTSVTLINRHVTATWSGPAISFGAVQIATRLDTGTDGDFFTENRVEYELLAAGQTTWTGSDQIEHPGTYFLRVDGWDDQCTFYDYGEGITGWFGCDTYSNIVQFTVEPICVKKLVRRGYWTKRPGHKRVWHKPVFKTVCS